MRHRFKIHTPDLPLVFSSVCWCISVFCWRSCWCCNETWLQLTP